MTVRGCSSPSCGVVHGGPIKHVGQAGTDRDDCARAANAVGLTALREVSPDLWARSTEESRAISGPLGPVTGGLSRSLADTSHRRSGPVEARTVQIPKLIVRVRFPSPAPGKPRSRHSRESSSAGTHGHSPGARAIGRLTDRKRPPKLFKLIVDSFEAGPRGRRSGQSACCPSHQAGRRASRPRGRSGDAQRAGHESCQ